MQRLLLYRDVHNAGHGIIGSNLDLGPAFKGSPSTWPIRVMLAFPADRDHPEMPNDPYSDVVLRRSGFNEVVGDAWYVDADNELRLLVVSGPLPGC